MDSSGVVLALLRFVVLFDVCYFCCFVHRSGIEVVVLFVVCYFICCLLQDTKKGKLRFYHGPIFWNYGYIPQTWEDPNVKHPEASCARRSEEILDVCRPMMTLVSSEPS